MFKHSIRLIAIALAICLSIIAWPAIATQTLSAANPPHEQNSSIRSVRPTSVDSPIAAIAPAAPDQAPIEPRLTLALAQASVAAYAAYEGTTVVPPANYKLVAQWTGWDASVFGGKEEKFGLLFQSTLPAQPKTFIFAFRGTDSDMDAYEDAFFLTTQFSPWKGDLSPKPYVSSGFYSVYDSIGGSMKQSMRQQLFSLLSQYQPQQVYITGHSLGAALSQLFTLDLAVSQPDLWVANLNFASPRVGTEDWKTAYESQSAQQDPQRRTVRVINYWDYAPTLPPSAFNYRHVGVRFRTAFWVRGEWYPHLLSRHSILNLQTVLEHAVWENPQAWVGTFQDATDPPRLMQSDVPPTGSEVEWADKIQEFQQLEKSIGGRH